MTKYSFRADEETSLVREEPNSEPIYDLEERTARFGGAIIDFAKKIPHEPLTDRIINQLVGAVTSVGANYIEADDFGFQKGIPEVHRDLQKEIARNKTFSPHGRPRSS